MVIVTYLPNIHQNPSVYLLTCDYCIVRFVMGVWQRVAMDSLDFQPGPPSPTLPRLASGSFLRRPYGRLRGGQPAGQAACWQAAYGSLLPLKTPHDVLLWRLLNENHLETSELNFSEEPNPQETGSSPHNQVLEHALHQLLREHHHNLLHQDTPIVPVTASIMPNKRRRLAGLLTTVRNFPCQTLKISTVSLVVMGS
jgi:hypothetical protein